MLFFRENPCHPWLSVRRATTSGLKPCDKAAWETFGRYSAGSGPKGCFAKTHAEQRAVPAAQYGAGNVPVHVTPIGARSIEHRWVKILSGLLREAQSLPRIACAESLALIAQ
jgi:hypothetical protein